jgi:hypothetical protein
LERACGVNPLHDLESPSAPTSGCEDANVFADTSKASTPCAEILNSRTSAAGDQESTNPTCHFSARHRNTAAPSPIRMRREISEWVSGPQGSPRRTAGQKMPQEGILLGLSISSVESEYASESTVAPVNLQRSSPCYGRILLHSSPGWTPSAFAASAFHSLGTIASIAGYDLVQVPNVLAQPCRAFTTELYCAANTALRGYLELYFWQVFCFFPA